MAKWRPDQHLLLCFYLDLGMVGCLIAFGAGLFFAPAVLGTIVVTSVLVGFLILNPVIFYISSLKVEYPEDLIAIDKIWPMLEKEEDSKAKRSRQIHKIVNTIKALVPLALGFWLPAVVIFGCLVLPIFPLTTAFLLLSASFAFGALHDLLLAIRCFTEYNAPDFVMDYHWEGSREHKRYKQALCFRVFSSLVKFTPPLFLLATPLVAGSIILFSFGMFFLWDALIAYDALIPYKEYRGSGFSVSDNLKGKTNDDSTTSDIAVDSSSLPSQEAVSCICDGGTMLTEMTPPDSKIRGMKGENSLDKSEDTENTLTKSNDSNKSSDGYDTSPTVTPNLTPPAYVTKI